MPNVIKQNAKGSIKKPTSVLSKIRPIGFGNEGLKILLYGGSGTGKTTLWGTFPGPILSIICSGGNKTGELRSLNTPELRKKVSSITLEDSNDLGQLTDHLKEGKYSTVVLDHVSGLQDLILKEVLGIDEIPAQKGWGTASQQQYGQVAQQCKERLRALLNLEINVVIIAQERMFNPKEDTGSDLSDVMLPSVGPAVIPSLAGWLNPACDYILQTYKRPKMETVTTKVGTKSVQTKKRGKGVEYCVRTEPHEIFTTKFRVPKGTPLPEVVVDPSYDKILKLINGGK